MLQMSGMKIQLKITYSDELKIIFLVLRRHCVTMSVFSDIKKTIYKSLLFI